MAAVNRNRQGSSASWTDTNFWAATKGGATGSSVPGTSGDSFSIFLGAGSTSITTGLDNSSASDLITLLCVEEGFGEDKSGISVGTSGSPLKFTHASQVVSTLRLQNRRFAMFNFSATAITLIDGQDFTGVVNIVGSEATTAIVGRTGTLNIGENVGLATLHTAGCTVNLAADASPANLEAWIAAGAAVNCGRLLIRASVSGILKMEGAASQTTGLITVEKGAVLDLQQSGNIAGVVAKPGSIVTGEYTPGWGQTKPTITVYRYPGADINLPTDFFTTTYVDVGNP